MKNFYESITVIIPTLNGGELFRVLLEGLAAQSVKVDELLVVDSGSDDDTLTIAKQYGAKCISISKSEFDHGATRTFAASIARGEIVVFFTQDAIPTDNDLIRLLIAPLVTDSQIAISYGRQLPASNASFSATNLRLFNYTAESQVRQFSDRETLGIKTAFVSNSCAAYRKSSLEEVGFFPERLIFGEDTCTAGRLLLKKYHIAYVAEASVVHSHNYSLVQEFRRSFDIGVLHKSESWLLETYGRAEGEGLKFIKFEFSMIWQQKKMHLLPIFFCRNMTKYIGYKLGSRYDILPQCLLSTFSMNSAWWTNETMDS